MNDYAPREREPQQPRHRAELPPMVPSPAELARLSDRELCPFVPKDRLADGRGVETEVTNRLWCRERNISRRHLQDLLEGRRKPKAGAKRRKAAPQEQSEPEE